MAKFTKEKEEQILRTYDRVKQYKRAAEIENVDARIVSRLVKQRARGLLNTLQKRKDGAGQVPMGATKKSPLPTQHLSSSLALSTGGTSYSARQEVDEAEIIEFYQNGGGIIDAVIKKRIPAVQADKIYWRFLQLKTTERLGKEYQALDDKSLRADLELGQHMRENKMQPVEYCSLIGEVDYYRSVCVDIIQLEAKRDRLEQEVQKKSSLLQSTATRLEQSLQTMESYKHEIARLENAKAQLETAVRNLNEQATKMREYVVYIEKKEVTDAMKIKADQIRKDTNFMISRAFWYVVETLQEDAKNILLITPIDQIIDQYERAQRQEFVERVYSQVSAIAGAAYEKFIRNYLREVGGL